MGKIGWKDLKLRLEPYVRRADSAILRVLSSDAGSPFTEPLMEFMRGGKRVRPVILLLVNEAVGGGGDPEPAAAAVELIHAASLIHDDIIDESETRRDSASFHSRYGVEMAILIADYILSLVLELASSYGDRRVGKIVSEATKTMSIGEAMEVSFIRKAAPISLDDYLRVLEYKTASLFRAASSLGALIAGRDHLIEKMDLYGLYLGLAYQIKDDLLDWGGKSELTRFLREDARDSLNDLALSYAREAVNALSYIPDSPQKEILKRIVFYSIERNG